MALARAAHGPYLHDNTGFTPQGTGPFTTSAFTPANNSLLCALVQAGTDSPGSEASYVVTGGSLTWTKRVNRTITFSSDGALLQFWTAPVATGASMQITVTHTGINSYAFGVFVYTYTGYDTSTPIGGTASNSDTATTNSLTLSASPVSGDEVIAGLMMFAANGNASDASAAPGSSFVEISDTNSADSFVRWQTQSRTASTSTAVSWTTATSGGSPFDQRLYGAMTIKEAAAGGGAAARVVGTGLTESRFLRKTRLAKAPSGMVGWRAQRGLFVPDRKLAA
jgi:hypothetical protein